MKLRLLLSCSFWVFLAVVAGMVTTPKEAQAQSCGGHSYLIVSPCLAQQGPMPPNTEFTVNYYLYQGTLGNYQGMIELVPYIHSGSSGIASCEMSESFMYLDWSTSYPVEFSMTCTTGNVPGNGTVDVVVRDDYTNMKLNGLNRAYATVYNGFNADIGNPSSNLHMRASCADACFSKLVSHSTVPFYTLDTPRSVSVIYDSDRHQAMPIIMVDVEPQEMGYSQYVKTANMTVALNGVGTLTTVNKGPAVTDGTPVRLSTQLDMRTYATGAYPITITITAGVMVLSDNGWIERSFTRTYQTKLIVVNDGLNAPIAPGWTIAGLQQLHFPSSGGYLLVENGGPAEYFASLGSGDSSNFTTLTYNTGTTKYTRTYRDGSKVTFNATGLMESSADRYGLTTTVSYVAPGKPSEIKEPMRVTMGKNTLYHVFDYLPSSFYITQRDNYNQYRTTAYFKNSNGITSIIDPDGDSTSFAYYSSPNPRLKSVTDRNGSVATVGYNSYGKVIGDTMPLVPIDAGSGTTIMSSPKTGYRPGMTLGMGTTAMLMRDTAYVRITNALGYVSKYITDVWGQPLSILDAIDNTTTIERVALQPTSISRPGIGTEEFQYSGDLITGVRSPSGAWTRYRYGAFAQVDSVWGDGVVPQRFFVNATTGNVDSVSTVMPGGQPAIVGRFTYDSYGRVLAASDRNNHVVYTHYDPVTGNTDSTLAAGNRWAKVKYDFFGRDSEVTGAGQPTARTHYDILNRPVYVHDGVNADSTKFVYDKLFRRSVRNVKGELADSAAYNALGWITHRYDTNDPTKSITYRYNRLGQVTSYTNRRGERINIQYDTLGRFKYKSGDNIVPSTASYSSSLASSQIYNTYAQIQTFVRPEVNVDSVRTLLGGRTFTVTHSSPDAFSSSNTVTISSPSGPSFTNRTFGKDASTGAVASITAGSGSLGFHYNSEGLRDSTSIAGGVLTRSEHYTSLHQKKEMAYNHSTMDAQFRRQYHLDSLGRIDEVIRLYWGQAAERKFEYDGLGRLSSVKDLTGCGLYTADPVAGYPYGCSVTPVNTFNYTYDAVGNRTDNSGYAAPGNRMTRFKGDSIVYDADGNIIRKYNGTTGLNRYYVWSAENMLLSVIDSAANPVQSVQFDYDASGQLVRRRTNGTIDRYWLRDGDHILATMDGSFNKLAEYVYEGTDRPVMEVSGSPMYHVLDEMGNVLGTHPGTTAINQELYYDPWGVTTWQTDATNTLRWKGLHWEGGPAIGGSGLYYMRARWYDPELGRFLSEDPIGIDGGMNQYVFGDNDPINSVDPSGLSSFCFLVPANVQWSYQSLDGTIVVVAGTKDKWQCIHPDRFQEFWNMIDAWRNSSEMEMLANFSAGYGDALLLGLGPKLREALKIEVVNQCSNAYKYGSYASMAMPGGARLAYAGAAKTIAMAAKSGAAASVGREALKKAARLGVGKDWRKFQAPQNIADAALRAKAGRTNFGLNAYGGGVVTAGAINTSGNGCR